MTLNRLLVICLLAILVILSLSIFKIIHSQENIVPITITDETTIYLMCIDYWKPENLEKVSKNMPESMKPKLTHYTDCEPIKFTDLKDCILDNIYEPPVNHPQPILPKPQE
ncbi:hypothetical protein CCP1ISM_2070004 [Azospirillaceae bacterium]